jgi:hypothetical protein
MKCMINTSSIPELNFSVLSISPKAKAYHIRRLDGKIRQVLWDLDYCFVAAKHWDKLTPVEKILLEEYGTDKLLELL